MTQRLDIIGYSASGESRRPDKSTTPQSCKRQHLPSWARCWPKGNVIQMYRPAKLIVLAITYNILPVKPDFNIQS